MADERPAGDALASASRQVSKIVKAAEQAAEELLQQTEERADARIAEAARAADNRVAAAEAEAGELVDTARRQAEILHATAESDASRIREDAEREAAAVIEEARRQAEEVQRIAEVFATQTRESAEQEAAKQIKRARDLAAEVFGDGTEMSHNLRQLSDSLRRNAEILLTDVTAAHRALTARIAEVDPDGDQPPAAATKPGRGAFEPDVPEFMPRAARRR
jgi:cell division septum initiation protein DivIVA